MEFKTYTEEELGALKLWDKSEYPFEIVAAVEKLSKKAKPMIEIKLKLSNGDGQTKTITDYLTQGMPEKFRHAAFACGLSDKYVTGKLSDADFIGKHGNLKLGVEKDKTGKYPPRNIVADYLF